MTRMISPSVFFAVLCLYVMLLSSKLVTAIEVTYDNRSIIIDGERKLLISGSIHYPRSTPQMWQSLIQKAKEGGLNTIETYVFWNAHEPIRRQYDFSGNRDLVRFMQTIKEEGLYAILRIGPYVCAEWTYGGFPVWLHNIPGIELRTNNPIYEEEMKTFVTLIVDKMKRHKLFASQGGPIILAQIENEYGNVMGPYNGGGKAYLQWCVNLALSYRIGIPWIMCQQYDAPPPMISTCNGYYCDNWHPRKDHPTPKVWTENWVGWFKKWGGQDPHRTAEDIAFAVARFYQRGGALQNYYMYHGGTNFGISAGGPYITTSYDYDAPLDEYGNLNQPKWGHLKQLHEVLISMEKTILYGYREDQNLDSARSITIYSYQGNRSCFMSNINSAEDLTFQFEGNDFVVPAWSVSILADCSTEVYNTAKVNAQTSIMVIKPNAADDYEEPYSLKWQWRTEQVEHFNRNGLLNDHPTLIATSLLDQKIVTNGTSDYLWLVTSVDHDASDPIWGDKSRDIILHVHTNGDVVHAFVNEKLVGTQFAEHAQFDFIFERKIKLNPGKNQISLLNAIVGYQNYGAFFDKGKNGIRGPIKLISRKKSNKEEVVRDISHNQWTYKTGLHGADIGLQDRYSHHEHGWSILNRPVNRPLTWYQTSFKSPLGTDPVVVDLMGLGKGVAWVNGHNLGRYWPNYLANEEGCVPICDYRGPYNPSKCVTNCGKPSQRWYHIPRDFLSESGNNSLVLFEENGGIPDLVSVETVTIGRICANAYEGNTLELSCQGGYKIREITFASFGLPTGTCGDFHEGTCDVEETRSVVEEICLGQESCSLKVSESTFGSLRCRADVYRLAIEAMCEA